MAVCLVSARAGIHRVKLALAGGSPSSCSVNTLHQLKQLEGLLHCLLACLSICSSCIPNSNLSRGLAGPLSCSSSWLAFLLALDGHATNTDSGRPCSMQVRCAARWLLEFGHLIRRVEVGLELVLMQVYASSLQVDPCSVHPLTVIYSNIRDQACGCNYKCCGFFSSAQTNVSECSVTRFATLR